MSKTYITPNYIKKYYMYDATTEKTFSFSTKDEMLHHLAMSLCGKWWLNYTNHIHDLIDNQNLTCNDIKTHHSYTYAFDEEGHCHAIHNVKKTFRPYIFYYKAIDGFYHILDIKTWVNDIKKACNENHSLWYKPHNWCPRFKWHPYQKRSKYVYKKEFVYIEDEFMPYISHATRVKDTAYHYTKFSSRSERCWKKQSKKRHQYGNATRNKYAESDFFDIDDYEETDIA